MLTGKGGMARRKPGGARGWLRSGCLNLFCSSPVCVVEGVRWAGVLAIIPSQASLSGAYKGIVQLNPCWGQQDMSHRAGGSSLDTWECVSAVRLV